jgi:hypothetical protein
MNFTSTRAIVSFLFRQTWKWPYRILIRLLSALRVRFRSCGNPFFSQIPFIFRLLHTHRPPSSSPSQSSESPQANHDDQRQSIQKTTTIYASVDHSPQDTQTHPTSSAQDTLVVSQPRKGSLGASRSTPNLSHTLVTSPENDLLTAQVYTPLRRASLARPRCSHESLNRTQNPIRLDPAVSPDRSHNRFASPSRLSRRTNDESRTIHAHSVALYRGSQRVTDDHELPREAFSLNSSPSREGSIRSGVYNRLSYNPSLSTSSVDLTHRRHSLLTSRSVVSLHGNHNTRPASQASSSNGRDTSLLRRVLSHQRLYHINTPSRDSVHLQTRASAGYIPPLPNSSSITVNIEAPSPTRDNSQKETSNKFSQTSDQIHGEVIGISAFFGE